MTWTLLVLALFLSCTPQFLTHVGAADTVDVVINPASPISKEIPPNFVSFSVEVFGMQWWTAVYPKPTRPSFINLIRQLNAYTPGPHPPQFRRIFRIGGNSADTSVYNPMNLSLPRTLGEITYNITDADILGMDRAMTAVDGQLIVGLNFRLPHDPTWPLRHVQSIEKLVGWKNIFALEIGNEVSGYPGGARGRPWGFSNYTEEWGAYVAAFYAQVPSLPKPFFQGLACYGTDWLPDYATFIAQHAGVVTTVSHHFYPESHSNVNASYLLKVYKLMTDGDAREESNGIRATVQQLAQQYPQVPFVIGEGNSVSGHGQLNVSTTFGACLWAVDEMMNDIAAGVYTWQWHNNVIEDFTLSSYTAFIYKDLDSDVPTVMPLYYAMRFVTEATRGLARMISVEQKSSNPLIKVSAFRERSGQRAEARVVILHKDYNATAPASVSITVGGLMNRTTAHYIVLSADSIFSNFGLSYGGQTYDRSQDGMPIGQLVTHSVQADSSGAYHLTVPPTSAILFTIPFASEEEQPRVVSE